MLLTYERHHRLPFAETNNCTLGVAVKTYFDELAARPDPTAPKTKEDAKAKGVTWMGYAIDFAGNLDAGFRLWDAVRCHSLLSSPSVLGSC